jgi:hypothetical protein
MPNIQPNTYVLTSTDGNTKITYETWSFIGQVPSLSLTQGSGPARHFTGSQVRTLSTEIGTLVSVTTLMSIDTGSTSLSLLIPAIGLPGLVGGVAFTTDAVMTRHAGPDSFPRSGVFETYEFIPMKGEASFVLALLHPVLEQLSKAAGV